MLCTVCYSKEVSEARLRLGFTTCLECGDKEALNQARLKESQVLPSHHKGGYTYVSPKQQRQLLLEATSKVARLPLNYDSQSENRLPVYRQPPTTKHQWRFSHFEFYYDPKLRRRVKRAVLIDALPPPNKE